MSYLRFFSQWYTIRVSQVWETYAICGLSSLAASNKYNLSSIRSLYSGAAPLGGPLATAVRQKLKKAFGTDVIIGQGIYGLYSIVALF